MANSSKMLPVRNNMQTETNIKFTAKKKKQGYNSHYERLNSKLKRNENTDLHYLYYSFLTQTTPNHTHGPLSLQHSCQTRVFYVPHSQVPCTTNPLPQLHSCPSSYTNMWWPMGGHTDCTIEHVYVCPTDKLRWCVQLIKLPCTVIKLQRLSENSFSYLFTCTYKFQSDLLKG